MVSTFRLDLITFLFVVFMGLRLLLVVAWLFCLCIVLFVTAICAAFVVFLIVYVEFCIYIVLVWLLWICVCIDLCCVCSDLFGIAGC